MKRVLISVEGQTEETFVREVLARHLWEYDVDPTPVLVTTKVVKSGLHFRGGLTTYHQVQRDVRKLLGDTGAVGVTTMYDLFQLPGDFPEYQTQPSGNCYARVRHLEAAFRSDIDHPRFKPYLQVHEFEAFLFIDPQKTNAYMGGSGQVGQLAAIKASFHSPEEIDDGPDTAPSKRILTLFPAYQKPFHGPLITIAIGLEPIRQACPHFREWLEWLEGLGGQEP